MEFCHSLVGSHLSFFVSFEKKIVFYYQQNGRDELPTARTLQELDYHVPECDTDTNNNLESLDIEFRPSLGLRHGIFDVASLCAAGSDHSSVKFPFVCMS